MKKAIVMAICAVLFVATVVVGVVAINGKISGYINAGSDRTDCTAPQGKPSTVSIYLDTDDFCTVISENPVVVNRGDTAVFTVVFAENYQLDQTNATYENGSVTVANCVQSATYTLSSKTVNEYYAFDYALPSDAEGEVVSSKTPGKHPANQTITISATPREDAVFTGWSVGGTVLDGGTMISYSQTYTFRLKDDVKLFPNFLKEGYAFIKYHLNGGVLASDGVTDEILTQVNTDIKPCPNLMADTGEIVRDGYTLLEFTTEEDGGGAAINPGGLADVPDSGVLEVWAQWARWTDAEQFSYTEADEYVTVDRYNGDDATVCVPEYINGKPVRDISANAFVNKSFDTLILPKTIRNVEAGAFVECKSFDTLYIFDTFTNIPENAFSNCKKFSSLRLNAGRNPSYPTNAESVATRLGYIMTREDYTSKPIILLVGGSSALFGFDSAYLEELLDNQYYVINCGTNAGGCGMLYIEALTSFMREGDIVVNVPEFGNVQFGDFTLYWRTFRATESCYNIYRYVDFSKYTNFFAAMSEFNSSSEARANLSERSYEIKNTSLTDINCDLNRTRVYYDRPAYSPISVYAGQLSDARAANFNTIIDIVTSKGIKYYIGSAPVYAYNLKSSDADIAGFVERMSTALNAPYISNPVDYKYEDRLFYDSQYHLTTEGALLRTEQLAEDLINQFNKEKEQ